tara:strand:- start:431 stop:574 length:144 start_codon:yes stop_codon:yes gene_type:complete
MAARPRRWIILMRKTLALWCTLYPPLIRGTQNTYTKHTFIAFVTTID